MHLLYNLDEITYYLSLDSLKFKDYGYINHK